MSCVPADPPRGLLDILKAYPQSGSIRTRLVLHSPVLRMMRRPINSYIVFSVSWCMFLAMTLTCSSRSFNAVNQLPRDKSFLGDVSGKITPQYRYNPPGNNQYSDVMPWGPTTEFIRQRSGRCSVHLSSRGQQVPRWSGPHWFPVSSTAHLPRTARRSHSPLTHAFLLSVSCAVMIRTATWSVTAAY